jgi:hypothetical protein
MSIDPPPVEIERVGHKRIFVNPKSNLFWRSYNQARPAIGLKKASEARGRNSLYLPNQEKGRR